MLFSNTNLNSVLEDIWLFVNKENNLDFHFQLINGSRYFTPRERKETLLICPFTVGWWMAPWTTRGVPPISAEHFPRSISHFVLMSLWRIRFSHRRGFPNMFTSLRSKYRSLWECTYIHINFAFSNYWHFST